MVPERSGKKVGETLGSDLESRIQLCGPLMVKLSGQRIEALLPGRQGRLLFAYLVCHRSRPVLRGRLCDVLWADAPPPAADSALKALLAKVRCISGPSSLLGKHEVRLLLPAETWVDLEAASEALHRAESAVARGDWVAAWGPARVALHVAVRPFLQGYTSEWVGTVQKRIDDMLLRAHECVAAAGLGLGSGELSSAIRSARALTELAPYRESGYRLMMECLAQQGNGAEALLVFERLRRLLRADLGTSPGSAVQVIHRQLLKQLI